MEDTLEYLSGVPVLVCAPQGGPVAGERDATDLIGAAAWRGAMWVALPVQRLGAGFFELRSGVAGGVVQKFAQYGVGLAVVGDVSGEVAVSEPLGAFVRESDRGRQLWFVADTEELRGRLARVRG
ncbi:hypothetical protein GCM10027570_26890 [Streptomonospora sediminis]